MLVFQGMDVTSSYGFLTLENFTREGAVLGEMEYHGVVP
jgi:hypothetical protein